MTSRELYTHVLTEINKVGAPTLLLEDFIYIANKAIQQSANKAYNKYDINQQSADDISPLKTDTDLEIKVSEHPYMGRKFYCELPADYLHLLTCSIGFEKVGDSPTDNQCKNEDEDGTFVMYPARRLTVDQFQTVQRNKYFNPMYKRPYYLLNKSNDSNKDFPKANEILAPTNSKMDNLIMSLNGTDRIKGGRHSNPSPVLMEIRCGKTDLYYPRIAHIDYIKSPMRVILSEAELDGVDRSQVLEFPDYICYEIINDIVKLVLENSSDPRLNTNPVVNQSIASGVPSSDKK